MELTAKKEHSHIQMWPWHPFLPPGAITKIGIGLLWIVLTGCFFGGCVYHSDPAKTLKCVIKDQVTKEPLNMIIAVSYSTSGSITARSASGWKKANIDKIAIVEGKDARIQIPDFYTCISDNTISYKSRDVMIFSPDHWPKIGYGENVMPGDVFGPRWYLSSEETHLVPLNLSTTNAVEDEFHGLNGVSDFKEVIGDDDFWKKLRERYKFELDRRQIAMIAEVMLAAWEKFQQLYPEGKEDFLETIEWLKTVKAGK